MKSSILLMVITIFVIILSSIDSKRVSKRKQLRRISGRLFSDDIESGLCTDPTFNSANRFPNMTVRLYKGEEYWELKGLPDRQAFLSDHGTIDLRSMAPVKNITTIATILEGPKKGLTLKFQKEFFWKWDQNGGLVGGGRGGEYWDQMPTDGFTTAFHNSNKTHPMFIALKEDKVFYYSTKEEDLDVIGNKEGHVGGKFGENFPPDIDAAFTWPKGKGEFNIYLFKEDKYCLRGFLPPKSGNYCDEWRENKELFGCLRGMTTTTTTQKTTTIEKATTTGPPSQSESEPIHDAGEEITSPTPNPTPSSPQPTSCGFIISVESSMLFTIMIAMHIFL